MALVLVSPRAWAGLTVAMSGIWAFPHRRPAQDMTFVGSMSYESWLTASAFSVASMVRFRDS